MVSSISSTNLVNQSLQTNIQKDDVAKLVKYVKGEALTQAPDTFTSNAKSSAGSAAIFEGIPLLNFLKRNKKLSGAATEAMKTVDGRNIEAFQKLLKKGEGKFTSRLANFIETANQSKRTFVDIKSATAAQAKAIKTADKAAKAAEKAVAKPNFFTTRAAAKAEAKAAKAAAGAAGKQITAEVVSTTSKLGKFGKFMKSSGAGFMLAFSGIMEGVSEVYPTFKELGFEKGLKQTGKSAIKVVGDTIGFIGGEYIGTALGAAAGSALAGTKIGAAIGSVVPGFGTAIGAIVGCACGMLGSFVMGKITKKITGKSEREKAAEQNEQNQINEIMKNQQTIEELKAEALLKLQDEKAMNNGELSEDSQIAYQSLKNLQATNPFAV